MHQMLKRLAKMVGGYGAVQWAGPLLSFIFTPIITRILTPSDYGIADYVMTIGSALGTFGLFAIPQALAAHYNDHPDEQWHRRLTGSALTLVWLIGVPVGLALVLFAPQVSDQAFGNRDYTLLFQLAGGSVFFGACATLLTAASQAGLHVRWGMLFSLVTIAGVVFSNVLFIIVLRLGALGMVLTAITPSVFVSIVALYTMRRSIARPVWGAMGLLLRSGAILLPTVMAGWALMVVDRLFLVRYITTDALGHYAIANKIAGLMHVAMTPLYTSWTALALSIQHEPDARERFAVMSRYLMGAVLIVALGLGLFSTEILIVMTRPAYLPAAPYVGYLAYVHVITAFGTVLYTSAMAAKQFRAVSWTVALGAGINILLNALLIPTYGIWGATFATIIGYGVPQFLLYPILQKRYPVPYPIGRILAALVIQALLLTLGTLLPPMWFPIRIGIKLVIFGILPISYILLGMVTRFEVQQVLLFGRNQTRLGWKRLRR